ncbi:MAG: bifunctional folylpolyglutamate synthase/dihydrofolate synthase [Proteobacteria bacterium]|nr:bifunctional folylpolyglutamate synthase/dihydrofolate synthase [Pseudomonadota bacterium]
MHRLLAALGDPHRRVPPVVHVAGTNGKGSLVAYLKAMLEAGGYRAHVYTSPHLVRFNERIVLAGQIIDDAALSELLERCERANGGEPITFFEITTAAAFLGFAETAADVLLLEVGLGGRLDATNVIERPALTAITPVSIDHQHFLGDTITAIAGEKAGTLKPGVPAAIGPQPADAAAVIAAQAAAVGAPLLRHGIEWSVAPTAAGIAYRGTRWTLELPPPGLLGWHQIANAGTAVACAEQLADRFRLDAGAIAAGLAGVRWPARMQRLTRGPLVAALPAGVELWLDGGHNASAGEALARTVETWSGPLHLVLGMLNTKDPVAFLRPLAGRLGGVRTVSIPGEANGIPGDRLAAQARAAGFDAQATADVATAVAELAARGPGRILICGSLYLAGTVLAHND